MTDATCSSCKFWVRTGTPQGDCRRRPPIALASADSRWAATAVWPRVAEHDYCGKFEEHAGVALERRADEAAEQAKRDLDDSYAAAFAPPPGWGEDLEPW